MAYRTFHASEHTFIDVFLPTSVSCAVSGLLPSVLTPSLTMHTGGQRKLNRRRPLQHEPSARGTTPTDLPQRPLQGDVRGGPGAGAVHLAVPAVSPSVPT